MEKSPAVGMEFTSALRKVTINKNQSGYFRIPFQDASQMQMILNKLGIKEITE